jgi:hypothetical protein
MDDSDNSLAALAGGAGAGIGSMVPLILQTDGVVSLLAAVAAGAMFAGVLLVALAQVRD